MSVQCGDFILKTRGSAVPAYQYGTLIRSPMHSSARIPIWDMDSATPAQQFLPTNRGH
ncbi:hypothetical protein DPMN_048458 [Dreissena polymorpha]|uniref:Uncharacterized protein n=1 Tax=Dreissena polymorpha TaxID=45954 RepID=A0A9D4DA20_DREPO|nr:hypothetical protein DPMN_048458 [Dreissena polymorpha]